MKRFSAMMLVTLMTSLLIFGCSKKAANVAIDDLDNYQDQIVKFSLKYPKTWVVAKDAGSRFVAFSSKDAMERFRDIGKLVDEEVPSAKIDIVSIKLTEGMTFDSVVAGKQFQPQVYSAPEKVTIDGVPAIKQTYKFDLGASTFQGEVYYATKDSQVVTVIYFEEIGGNFEALKPKFDEILKSVKLAYIPKKQANTPKVAEQAPPPSSNLMTHKADGFTIGYPDNFDYKPGKAAGAMKSYNYIGERRADCNVQIDVVDAKGKDVNKVVNEAKGKYKSGEPKTTSLSGKSAFMLNYSFSGDISSRVYWVVNNNKLYRITMNWFKGEQKDYLPIFEKMVNSFKFQ